MCMSGMLAGHEGCTRRRTDRTAGVCLSKAHTLLRHTVQVWSFNTALPIAAKVGITHIIAHDEDDVGAPLLFLVPIRCRRGRIGSNRKQTQCCHDDFSYSCHKGIVCWLIVIRKRSFSAFHLYVTSLPAQIYHYFNNNTRICHPKIISNPTWGLPLDRNTDIRTQHIMQQHRQNKQVTGCIPQPDELPRVSFQIKYISPTPEPPCRTGRTP